MEPPPAFFCGELSSFLKPSTVLDKGMRTRMVATAMGLKVMLETKAGVLIEACQGKPLLVSYSSDSTSQRYSHHNTSGDPASSSVKLKSGQRVSEFLVHQAFLRFIDFFGQRHTAVLLDQPIWLAHGKGGQPSVCLL